MKKCYFAIYEDTVEVEWDHSYNISEIELDGMGWDDEVDVEGIESTILA